MEVHAHSHTERKKWTHYLWEFLMLFFAVTLSFVVENEREHFIESQRAKKFAASLISDLQSDTAEIKSNIQMIGGFYQSADMVISELRKSRSFRNDTILQVQGLSDLFQFDFFDPQLGTYEEIKNSGSLRYFNRELVNKLNSYYSESQRLLQLKQDYLNFMNAIVTPFIVKMLNNDFIDAVDNKINYSGRVFIKEPDSATISEWKNVMNMIRVKQDIQKVTVEGHREQALKLMDQLKQEYHLK